MIDCLVGFFIELSNNKLMSKIQPVVTRWKDTIRKEKTYDVVSIQGERSGNSTKKARKKRHPQINKRKKRKKHVWLSGRRHIE